MTSKISCFDHAVFRRALKMTAPVWILYALYELLLPLRLFSFCRGLSSGADNYIVQIEKTLLSYARFNASIVPFLLGGLLAWVLFSWLFRAGTAYFYAALPVRRETLFLTNYLTGMLLCAAPALLSALLLWAVGAGFGAAAFVPAMQVFAVFLVRGTGLLRCGADGCDAHRLCDPEFYVLCSGSHRAAPAFYVRLRYALQPEQHHAVVCAARHAGAGAAAGLRDFGAAYVQ